MHNTQTGGSQEWHAHRVISPWMEPAVKISKLTICQVSKPLSSQQASCEPAWLKVISSGLLLIPQTCIQFIFGLDLQEKVPVRVQTIKSAQRHTHTHRHKENTRCFSRHCERFHLIHSEFLMTCWCFHLAPICQRELARRAGFRPDEWMPAADVTSAAEVRSVQTGSEACHWLADSSKQSDRMTDGIKARVPMVA